MKNLEVRTQIYLEKSQHDALKQKAAQKSVSMAQIIREAVTAYLSYESQKEDEMGGDTYVNDPIWNIPELAKSLGPSGAPDGSANHDKYIYGLEDANNDGK